MHKCHMERQNFIDPRQLITDYPFGTKNNQCQGNFGAGGQRINIYKWINPEYNLNCPKMNHPKVRREGPYNRKCGPSNRRPGTFIKPRQYWVQHFERSDGSRGHLKWVNPESDSNKRKIKDHQHRDQEHIWTDGPQTQFVRDGARDNYKWINPDYKPKKN